jgi:hypothetical protein
VGYQGRALFELAEWESAVSGVLKKDEPTEGVITLVMFRAAVNPSLAAALKTSLYSEGDAL